ncbi:protein ENL-like [Patiria miniata]|uniref:YEATS domain-containing protein n=1 Tax=Patiria miniata TaxID=46514 RepID=A0A914AUX2_PATMI|nr:protein ENL-like [Patiria miniata]
MSTQSVQVKLELGHRANIRDKPTPQGFTHDWMVFVRGPEGSNIHHFVDKVVFQLHESFPKPRRVVKEPPYEVAESGYAGFLMTIEVHFRSKEEPKKVILNYDLFLNTEQQPPVNHIRCEKLTFHNPTEDFRRKLLKAGGVGVLPTDPGIPTSPTTPPNFPVSEGGIGGKPLPPSFSDSSLYAKGKPQAAAPSLQVNKKKTQAAKDGSKTSSKPVKDHKEVKTASKEPKTSSKEPKTGSKEPKTSFKEPKPGPKEPKTGSKEPKTGSKEPKSSSGKDSKVGSKDSKTPVKDTKSGSKEPKSGSKESKTSPKPPPKDSTKTKPSAKRPSSTSPAPAPTSQDSAKKRKRKDSSDRGPHEKSSLAKPSPAEKSSSGDKAKQKEKPSKPKTAKPAMSRGDAGLFTPEICISRKPSKMAPEPPKELPPFEDELSTGEGGEAHSPSSSISFSSLPRGGGGVLNTLMAELGDENDDDDDDQDIGLPYRKTPSPIPPLPPLSNHSTSSNEQGYGNFPSVTPAASDKTKSTSKSSSSKKNSTSNGSKKNSYSSKGERKQKGSDSKQKSTDAKQKTPEAKPKSSDGKQRSSENKSKAVDTKPKHADKKSSDSKPAKTNEGKLKHADSKLSKGNQSYLNDLVLLHQKLSHLQNRDQLQRVVDLIEETGLFNITDATFDFDLCSLDQTTLRKLQECVSLFA